jgi:hypothetical protein
MNPKPDPQEEVFRFLAKPETHGGHCVKRIDTHASALFLAGTRAFKVKRAVRFPFLDYATLDKRKNACMAEIEVNRPFAPDIYRGVIAVTREAEGQLALVGKGEPVEWAVEMRRFDETKTLDCLAERGEIDLALADEIAREVAKAHAQTPIVDAQPWIEALSSYIEQNDNELRARLELFPVQDVDHLSQASRAALARIRPLLAARGKLGLVRRGHGDLHLGNIVLIDGKPLPFDAIEFDPLIATGDVLYDLAFLLMDMVERGLKPAANAVLNRYLSETRRAEDFDALAALPLFLSLRAAIRAKVTAARIVNVAASERQAATEAAKTYFRLALALIAPSVPKLIAVGGLSGAGKSALARMLAPDIGPDPGAVILRSDVERKALFGIAETGKLPPAGYAPEVTKRVYAALAEKARRAIAAGHSAIVDAVFAREPERAAIATAAKSLGVAFNGLFLTAGLKTRLARVGARTRDASDADAKIAREQENYELGRLDWMRVDASGTADQTLANARAALAG